MLGDEVLLAFRLIFIETIKKKSYQNENDWLLEVLKSW